jgi:hypothetical protein
VDFIIAFSKAAVRGSGSLQVIQVDKPTKLSPTAFASASLGSRRGETSDFTSMFDLSKLSFKSASSLIT